MCSVLFDKLSFRNLEPVSIADCDPTNINYVDDNGITPLHRACIFHSRRFIELLVDHGADLNRQCVHLGQTPFHYACMNQALGLEDFQFLVGQGVIWKRDLNGETPRDIALRFQSDPAVCAYFKNQGPH